MKKSNLDPSLLSILSPKKLGMSVYQNDTLSNYSRPDSKFSVPKNKRFYTEENEDIIKTDRP